MSVSVKQLESFEKDVAKTHRLGLKSKITELPAKIKKQFYYVPIKNIEAVEIWSLVNSKFVVHYASTNEMFLFPNWFKAKEFRELRVKNILAKHSLYR